ncbi:MAG: ATP-binding protein [Phycisphaerae bacterium]|nr:ATP-binding protein [Phycisphaerae bacterium]
MSEGRKHLVGEAEVWLAHDQEEIRRAEHALLRDVASANYSEASSFAIRLALEEAVYNAFRHGHKTLPHSEKVLLSWRVTDDEVIITVEDKGPGFKPSAVPDPTTSERLELPHGRGVMLMKAYMTVVQYNEKGNRVTMIYKKPH